MTTVSESGHGLTVTLAGVVLILHLLANAVHTVAHVTIPVFLPPLPTAGIVLVTIVLPIVGLGLVLEEYPQLGSALFALSMALSFGIGVTLHFGLPNPDNVSAIASGPWTLPFSATAGMMVGIDAIGVGIGLALIKANNSSRGADGPHSARIRGVSTTGFRPLTRVLYWGTRRLYGDVLEPVTIWAHHRSIVSGTTAFELGLRNADLVDTRLKELAVFKVAMLVGCDHCLDLGTALATDRNITETQLRALHQFETSDAFSDLERTVLRYADAISQTPPTVSDELFDTLHEEFNEAELVELTAAIAWENYRARFNRAFDVDAQGFSEGDFCPRPEQGTVHGRTDGSSRP